MLNKQLQELSKETKGRIRRDAANWNKSQYGNNDVNDDYLEGALHEAKLAQAAEAKAERYEKALKLIEQMSDPGDYWLAVCRMKSIASDALTPKTNSNDRRL